MPAASDGEALMTPRGAALPTEPKDVLHWPAAHHPLDGEPLGIRPAPLLAFPDPLRKRAEFLPYGGMHAGLGVIRPGLVASILKQIVDRLALAHALPELPPFTQCRKSCLPLPATISLG